MGDDTLSANSEAVREKKGDRVFTPEWCVLDMLAWFRPEGRILEPFRGDGAFYRHLPAGAFWCEIDAGRDFFNFHEPVDWIISNPPYSKLRPVVAHSFAIAKNIVYLIPLRNFWSGYGFIEEAYEFGGIVAIRCYGTGGRLGFPMGNAIGAVHWQKGYKGPIHMSFLKREDKKEPRK